MRGGSSAGEEAAAFTTNDGSMDSDQEGTACGWLVDGRRVQPPREARALNSLGSPATRNHMLARPTTAHVALGRTRRQ
jgi:hypothetical protein